MVKVTLFPDGIDRYSDSKILINLPEVAFTRSIRSPTVAMQIPNEQKQRKMRLKEKRMILLLPWAQFNHINEEAKVMCVNRLLHHQLEYYKTTDAINMTWTSFQCDMCKFLLKYRTKREY
ncbi:hypothetical protein M3Y98_00022100 [Aphelenchoides besseyi]|nr:hypothetical protein M3Y98_00022100 [Aphelenchoides besseyi]KAI6199262.1 hypothetical protein M3Y96_00608100 [Aphelenchoides besseyi]